MKIPLTRANAKPSRPMSVSISKIYTKHSVPWLFLLPAVVCFAFLVWHPIVSSFFLSVQDVRFDEPNRFVGLRNFEQLFSKNTFWISWRNTFYYSGLALLFGYMVPVFLAIMMNEVRRFKSFFRLSLYIPAMVPLVVAALMWRWIYNPAPSGLLNTVLGWFGAEPLSWLGDPALAMPSIVLISTWLGMGSTALIYLAGLQGIPVDLYEAAEIDGANPFKRMVYITFPQLMPILLITLILQILGTLKVFTEPFLLTDGGPANATITVMLEMYYYAFKYMQFGAASAYGVIIFIVLLLFTVLYFRIIRKLER